MYLISKLSLKNLLNSNLDTKLSIILVIINVTFIISIFDHEKLLLFVLFHVVLFLFLPQKSIKQILIPILFISLFLFLMYIIKILSIAELITVILKLFNLNILFTWFYLGNSPRELTEAMVWFKIPYSWAWTISSSFRFIDLFVRETKDIFVAQLLRGIPLDGNIFERMKFVPSIILPLFIRVQIRNQQLAEALFIRGWNPYYKKKLYSKKSIMMKNNFFWGFIFLIDLIIINSIQNF